MAVIQAATCFAGRARFNDPDRDRCAPLAQLRIFRLAVRGALFNILLVALAVVLAYFDLL